MKIRVCIFLLSVLFLIGCDDPEDLIITSDQKLSGIRPVKNFRIAQGATVTLDGDLTIKATNDIIIHGEVLPLARTDSSLTLESENGDVIINGRIWTGHGNEGANDQGLSAAAKGGGKGGGLLIKAIRGNVMISGKIRTGEGGTGGNATAQGTVVNVQAIAGYGGNGGEISIYAARNLIMTGSCISGRGGDGGNAVAFAVNDLPTSVLAEAHSGGNGGEIEIANRNGRLQITGNVRTGTGGNTGTATVKNGKNPGGNYATAKVCAGGNGGNITVDKVGIGPLTIDWHRIITGGGGHAGKLAKKDRAVAHGTVEAEATVFGGGLPGFGLEKAKIVTRGEAGNSGRATAKLKTQVLPMDGSTHYKVTPGRTAFARLPI